MSALPELFELAYKRERAMARKRQQSNNLSEEQSLIEVLKLQASPRTLETLLAERRAEREKQRNRLSARQQKQIEQRARHHGVATSPDAWLGWFDGSVHPNPGRMSIGALLRAPDGTLHEISADAGQGDSSVAEYLALHALLEAAIAQRVPKLIVHGDSRVVIDDVLRRDGKTAAVLETYRLRTDILMTQLQNVELRWVPRHRNERADALSQPSNRINPDTTAGAKAPPFLAAPSETQ